MYEVMSGVRKRVVTVWVAVCFLLGTCGCLPLDHTCLNFAAAGLGAGAYQTPSPGWSGPIFTGRTTTIETTAGRTSSNTHEACLACVWAHSLLDNHSAVTPGAPDDTRMARWSPPEILIPGTEHFQAPFKRGPPSPAA